MNSSKNKRILITGSSGMLGSNACLLMNNSFSITGTYFSNKPYLNNIKSIKLDIRNNELCKKEISSINPDIIIHCAAITDLDLCETNKKLAYDVNTDGTKNVLESINKNCHFIFISTDNIYNNGKQFNRENAKNNITNIYGDTKQKAEHIIMNSKIKHTILRTNFFGWHLAERETGFLNFVYNNLKNYNQITLFHDVYFTPISIPNLIIGLIEIIKHGITGTYNFGGHERLSKLDFGLLVADIFKLEKKLIIPISIDEKGFIANRPKEMSMDSNKISKYVSVPQR
ncbi:MAG: SDR family oxidoreductase, partial [Mariniphaga sp.]|nr:SDR family oxidoreductase [Mariniphaga sp.]